MTWYDDRNNLAALWSWLEDCHKLPADGPAYFMEKPWKWQDDWDSYQAAREAGAEFEYDPERQRQDWDQPGVRLDQSGNTT
jgi:hypothetical protein